jgi:phage terminase large subunit
MTRATNLDRLRRELGELLERHERARDIKSFAPYRDDPVSFIRDVLGGAPWSAQIEIAQGVRDNPLVVVRSCNGAGKDWLAARLALWWVYARKGFVLVTGPTERQVKNVVMGEVRAAFARVEGLPGDLFETALRVDRDERVGILAFTSSTASSLTGFHAPRLMVVITEAQGVEPFAWEAMHANLSGAESRFLAVGNPLAPSGDFFNANRSPTWRAFRLSAAEHPNVVEGREVIPGAVGADFVERMAREYGRGSGIYRSRVEGEFPDSAEDGLFRRTWIAAAFARHARMQPDTDHDLVAGIDPARLGPDSTVLAVRRGPVLTHIKTWTRLDLAEMTGRLVTALREVGFRPSRLEVVPPWQRTAYSGTTRRSGGRGRLIVDSVGVGGGVLDRLRELGYKVTDYNGGRTPRNTRKFLNRRAETSWQLRSLLEAGEIALPTDERLADELLATRWKPTSSGQVQIEAKDDLRARLGRSPDRADAVVMAFSDFNPTTRRLEPLHY